MRIAATTAVVAGATTELGIEVALTLQRRGATVFGFDASCSDTRFWRATEGVELLTVDVADPIEVRMGLETVAESAAPLRVVVICDTISSPFARVVRSKGPFDIDLFASEVRTNLLGPFNVIALAAERIVGNEPDPAGERGVVVTASGFGGYGSANMNLSRATCMSAVAGLAAAIAPDLELHGIRVRSFADARCLLESAARPEVRNPMSCSLPHSSGEMSNRAARIAQLIEGDQTCPSAACERATVR